MRNNLTDTILEANALQKSFGAVSALTDASITIQKGEIVALVGDNGAGKSTLIKILAGVLSPDKGSLRVKGEDVKLKRYSVCRARALGIEAVYQERSLGEKQPLWRNFFVGRHFRNSLGFIDVAREKQITLKILQESIGLNGAGVSADALVGTLSGGERQGLTISRAMYFNAMLTILDEPTTAMAVCEVRKILQFIRSIPKDGGAALFVSHNLHHVHEVADRFVFLHRGRIAYQCMKAEMSVTGLFTTLEGLSAEPDRGRGH